MSRIIHRQPLASAHDLPSASEIDFSLSISYSLLHQRATCELNRADAAISAQQQLDDNKKKGKVKHAADVASTRIEA